MRKSCVEVKGGGEHLWDARALLQIAAVIEVVAALAHLHRLGECSLKPHACEVKTKWKQVVDVVPVHGVDLNKTVCKQLVWVGRQSEGKGSYGMRRGGLQLMVCFMPARS